MIGKYLKGWTFRAARPTLTVGDTVDAFVSEYDEANDVGIARIGDTVLYVEGAGPEHEEYRVRVEVTSFDPDASTGRGSFEGVVGESSYSS